MCPDFKKVYNPWCRSYISASENCNAALRAGMVKAGTSPSPLQRTSPVWIHAFFWHQYLQKMYWSMAWTTQLDLSAQDEVSPIKCTTFAPATIAPIINAIVKRNPNPNLNLYPTPNQKPNHYPHSNSLLPDILWQEQLSVEQMLDYRSVLEDWHSWWVSLWQRG